MSISTVRRQYPFDLIEPKWQGHWEVQQTFRAFNPGDEVPAGHPFALRHGIQGAATEDQLPPKCYILDMFPYPSGAGLHVGHPEGYTATDILSRYRRARGWNVLHPMGWDAFGLPAEQYAIKTGQHPRITTNQNISTFKRQIKSLGFSYDWCREVDTTDPEYYRWTQWIFLQIYGSWFNPVSGKAEPIDTLLIPDGISSEEKRREWVDSKRLAYVSEAPVWWCEALGTVLANEEVIDGRSEVGDHPVTRRPMRQWMLRITAYADRLLKDLETIEWSDSLKEMQRNWIGRSDGANVRFTVKADVQRLQEEAPGDPLTCDFSVFTTRPDTLFGATYLVLAPELEMIDAWLRDEWLPVRWPDGTRSEWTIGAASPAEAVLQYRETCARKSDLERTDLAKEKTGVFTGLFAANPVNQQRMPVWIADYVLANYGTGAIMAVPGHDTRDLEFARKFNLPVIQVVQPLTPGIDWQGFVDDGTAVNSSGPDVTLDGLPTPEAKRRIIDWLVKTGQGSGALNYKLRDWLFSRQRYWGEPFPILWKPMASGAVAHEALPVSALPLVPPPLEEYKPTPDGQPPLARAGAWMHLPDGSTREANTMPQWAGSCWYYLRYLDAGNSKKFLSERAERYWMGSTGRRREGGTLNPGVDLYVGGTEHAVLHLLYARFWHKMLFDLGHVSTPEPFFKLVNQGLILGDDGQKMSKSRGNVVNPDDILQEYGADAFRLYEMFMGPLQDSKPWNTQGVEGVYRFLGRVWRLFVEDTSDVDFQQRRTESGGGNSDLLEMLKLQSSIQDSVPEPAQLKTLHACIKKVTEDLDGLRFNTAISALMVFVNDALAWPVKPVSILRPFLQLLASFAPHLAEELWLKLHVHIGKSAPSLSYAPWPEFDPARLIENTAEIPVQINGKLRDVLRMPAGLAADRAALEKAAFESDKVKLFLEGKTVRKVIVVPGKLVNLVA